MKSHPLLSLSLGVFSLALTPAVRAADKDVEGAGGERSTRRSPPPGARTCKPAPRADDAEFFRRVHLDLAGRIPSITEIRDFLDDDRPDKRRLWVDRILQADATTRPIETPTSTTSPTSGGPGCWPRPTSRLSSNSRPLRPGCGTGSGPTSATTGSCAICSPSRSRAMRAAGRKGRPVSSTRPTSSSRRTWRAARPGCSSA